MESALEGDSGAPRAQSVLFDTGSRMAQPAVSSSAPSARANESGSDAGLNSGSTEEQADRHKTDLVGVFLCHKGGGYLRTGAGPKSTSIDPLWISYLNPS